MEAILKHSNNLFSFRRFGDYFQFFLATERRKLLLGALQIFIISLLVVILSLYFSGIPRYEYLFDQQEIQGLDPFFGSELELMAILAFIFMAFAGSWTFSAMTTKKGRLNTIEVPASQTEKFLTWWIIFVPLTYVVMMASFWLVDLIRYIWVVALTPYGEQAGMIPLSCLLSFRAPQYEIFEETDISAKVFQIYGLLLLTNALFAAGSILFHKLSFLKTILFGFIVTVVCAIIFSFGDSILLGEGPKDFRFSSSNEDAEGFVIGGIILFIVLCLYVYAFFRYREEEVITRW